jgi:hypothetical protein
MRSAAITVGTWKLRFWVARAAVWTIFGCVTHFHAGGSAHEVARDSFVPIHHGIPRAATFIARHVAAILRTVALYDQVGLWDRRDRWTLVVRTAFGKSSSIGAAMNVEAIHIDPSAVIACTRNAGRNGRASTVAHSTLTLASSSAIAGCAARRRFRTS